MRGLIFTEYFSFIGTLSDDDVIDEVLTHLGHHVTGAYTSVGNYSFEEFAKIHVGVCEKLALDGTQAARQFGHWLMARFAVLFPQYLEGVESGIEFLEKTGAHIHVEVRKLYPDASPPEVSVKRLADDHYQLYYRSHRPLAPVAIGLTEASLAHFNDQFKVVGHETRGGETVIDLRVA